MKTFRITAIAPLPSPTTSQINESYMRVVKETSLTALPLSSRGKVRDIYDLGDKLLIVTTDRMSAFDVVMAEPIPYKGVVLNQLTLFWMERFKDLVPNHLIATDVADFPETLQADAGELEGRTVVVTKAKPLPIECIVRGNITGSGWKDYQKTGTVCGHALPQGMQESERLPEPLFTPSTKAELGAHDENITLDAAREMLGEDLLAKVEEISLTLFKAGRDEAAERGIIIADTKFEFGLVDGELVLIDEVLTPDSSRFWPAEGFAPGRSQPSFDKQYLRDWLQNQDWDKTPPPPALPEDVVEQTMARYLEAYRLLTGVPLNIPQA